MHNVKALLTRLVDDGRRCSNWAAAAAKAAADLLLLASLASRVALPRGAALRSSLLLMCFESRIRSDQIRPLI